MSIFRKFIKPIEVHKEIGRLIGKVDHFVSVEWFIDELMKNLELCKEKDWTRLGKMLRLQPNNKRLQVQATRIANVVVNKVIPNKNKWKLTENEFSKIVQMCERIGEFGFPVWLIAKKREALAYMFYGFTYDYGPSWEELYRLGILTKVFQVGAAYKNYYEKKLLVFSIQSGGLPIAVEITKSRDGRRFILKHGIVAPTSGAGSIILNNSVYQGSIEFVKSNLQKNCTEDAYRMLEEANIFSGAKKVTPEHDLTFYDYHDGIEDSIVGASMRKGIAAKFAALPIGKIERMHLQELGECNELGALNPDKLTSRLKV